VTGRMDLLVLTESTKSLQYRVEYWVATWAIIRQARHWLWGIGPANFSYYYMQFKLPQASEEISDPHNQLLEVWVTAGILALVAFSAAVLLAIWRMTRDEKHEPQRLTDYEIFAIGSVQAQILGYSAAAFIMAPVLGGWNLFQEDLLRRWLVLLGGWGIGWLLCRSVLARCQIRAEHLAAALVAISVTWLAAGGVGFPSVSMLFWFMLAMGLNLSEPGWRMAKTRVVFDIKLLRFLPIAACVAVLGGFLGVAIPFWKAELARSTATDLLNRPSPNFGAARQQILQAMSADPKDASSALKLADLEYQAWVVGGAKANEFDVAWAKISAAYHSALTPPRNPLAVTIWRREASFIDQLIKLHGDRIAPQTQLKLLGERAKCLRTAARLYPNLASIWADLAEIDAALGLANEANTEAARAIELSNLMPHADKKLDDATMARMQAISGK
jgi:O-Antigen ligase